MGLLVVLPDGDVIIIFETAFVTTQQKIIIILHTDTRVRWHRRKKDGELRDTMRATKGYLIKQQCS